MALQIDLMFLGMPPQQADRIGYNPLAVTAAGTTSLTATAIHSKMANVTAASSQTGVILPNTPGDIWLISCSHASSASAVVYPTAGATITNGASITVAQDKNVLVWQFSATLYFHIALA